MRMLLIGSTESPYCREIIKAATQQQITCDVVPFDRLASHLKGTSETFSSFPPGQRAVLNDYDVSLVRNMPGGSLEQIIFRMDLLWSLEASGVRVINPPKAIECAVDKYLTLARCRRAGLAIPETCCCESAEQAMLFFEEMNRDIVLKPLFGAEGRGVIRITEPETAFRVFRAWEQIGSVLYLQRYLESGQEAQCDIRILVLDGKPLGAIKRSSTIDFRTNCSLNGLASPHTPSDEETEMAQRASQVTGAIFAGIDLIYDRNKKLHLLEVNACPGWNAFRKETGIDVPAQLAAWLKAV